MGIIDVRVYPAQVDDLPAGGCSRLDSRIGGRPSWVWGRGGGHQGQFNPWPQSCHLLKESPRVDSMAISPCVLNTWEEGR